MSWILVVDDDEDLREVLVVLLRDRGRDAEPAADGLAALERIRARGRPDLIFVDLRMPNMNGIELIAVLRGDPQLRHVPVVVVSGDVLGMERVRSLGVSGYLKKPFSFGEVSLVIERFVDRAPTTAP
jgi:CheY-like chemotaxis protein